MDFPLRMLFSKIVRDGNLEIALDENAVLEALNKNSISLEAHLQDDLYLEDYPDERVIDIDCEDDLWRALNDSYVSKTYGCRFGRGCCFVGVIIENCDEDAKPLTKPLAKPLEERIANAQKWVNELKEQKRLSNDTKLAMVSNCCS